MKSSTVTQSLRSWRCSPRPSWERLVAWLAVGLVIYGAYGRRHSLTEIAGPRPML